MFFYQRNRIRAEYVDEEPNNYINITEEQMKKFPHVKEAILKQGSHIDTPYDEFLEFNNLLDDEETEFIKYQNEYYKIDFSWED